jgi:hypothetical protein
MRDPVIVACERWKARIVALGIVVGTLLIITAMLLLEAHTIIDVWVFTHTARVGAGAHRIISTPSPRSELYSEAR